MTFKRRKFVGADCIEYEEQWNWADFRKEYPKFEDFCAAFDAHIAALIKKAGGIKMPKGQ